MSKAVHWNFFRSNEIFLFILIENEKNLYFALHAAVGYFGMETLQWKIY